jgi:membrane protease YdiL (CAAX protease family)
MNKISLSIKIYILLVVLLAILAAIYIFLPQGSFSSILPEQSLPASKPILALVNAAVMLILYGGLGFIGLKLSQKLDFPKIWDEKVSNKQRLLTPALIGGAIGIVFILTDIVLAEFNIIGHIPHPQFPASLVGSATAGIGEEIIFRLFFIPFWLWLISYVLLKNRWQNLIFWILLVISALIFSAGHFYSMMIILGFTSISQIPLVFLAELVFLNSLLGIFSGYYFRKFGFLAAVGVHFWTDIVWHVIWGII